MTYPVRGVAVGTPYGKRGVMWSCNRDSQGQGIHSGVDFPAKAGTAIYAPIAGQIRHRSYGSAFGKHQFAISPDADQPFGKGEVFFAHTRTRLADGVRVEVGDFIAEVGSEGNVTGAHLHMEYMPSTKNQWRCGIHADPQPVLDHALGPYVTKNIYTDKLGYGEPTNGDTSSDTVTELQEHLNRIPLVGGKKIPVTGRYDDDTDAEVQKWQKQICGDVPDPIGKSYLGPKQAATMFSSPPYTIHDRGLPKIAVEGAVGTELGAVLSKRGFIVHDTDVPLGRSSTWSGVKFLMVHHTASPDANTASSDARWIRSGNEDAPLAQLMLDRKGEVWICCSPRDGQSSPGRASHAGLGKGFGVPDNKMNEVSLGIEVCNDGTTPLSSNKDQYETLIRLLAVLSDYYAVDVEKIIGHKEWSSVGKVDPLDRMSVIRSDVRSLIDDTLPPDPPEPPPVTEPRFLYRYSGKPSKPQSVGTSYSTVDLSSFTPPADGLLISMLYLNCAHTFKSGVDSAGFRVRSVRSAWKNSAVDASGYGDFTPNKNLTKPGEFLLTHVWFEMCDGDREIHWEVDRASQFASFELGTRYTKWVWINSKVLDSLAQTFGTTKEDVATVVRTYLEASEAPDESKEISI